MFCSRQGHTEGKTNVVFILISTDSLYILSQEEGNKRFSKEVIVPFLDIDFVSVSLFSKLILVGVGLRCPQGGSWPVWC